jgi:hypothetical protein
MMFPAGFEVVVPVEEVVSCVVVVSYASAVRAEEMVQLVVQAKVEVVDQEPGEVMTGIGVVVKLAQLAKHRCTAVAECSEEMEQNSMQLLEVVIKTSVPE